MEEFALKQADKLSKIQTEIEQERKDLEKNLKDKELESASEKLDMKLAMESQKLQQELKRYTKANAKKKKMAQANLKKFYKEKKKAKNRNDSLINLAKKERDRKLALLKENREKQKKMWEKDRERRQKAFEKDLAIRYKNPRAKASKNIDRLNMKVIDMTNKVEDEKIRLDNNLYRKEQVWKKMKSDASGELRTEKEEIALKYDNLELDEKRKFNQKREKFQQKRTQLLSKLSKEKKKSRIFSKI